MAMRHCLKTHSKALTVKNSSFLLLNQKIVDLNDTPRKYIPLIVKVFALHSKKDKGKEEYCLRKFKIEAGRVEGKKILHIILTFSSTFLECQLDI
jgi:hypothetical protein